MTMVTNTPPEMLAAQIDAVFEDIPPVAVKIGMVSSVELINVIADRLIAHDATNIVLDPVMWQRPVRSLSKATRLRH